MKNEIKQLEVEVLHFVRHSRDVATIVTDGHHVRSYTAADVRPHSSVFAAISWLECQGFKIQID